MAILKVVGASWLRTKVSSYILGLLGVLSILTLLFGQLERTAADGNYAATVFYSNKTGYRIEFWGQSNDLAEIPRGVARAFVRSDVNTDGWSLLEVETDGSYRDEIQAYSAGILEGALTWYLIHNHLENTIRAKCEDTLLEKQCSKLKDALDQSVDRWKNHADDQGKDNPFWHHVSLHFTQIDGIYTGWKHGIERSGLEYDIDKSELYWLNFASEVAEIQHKLNISLDDPALEHLPGLSSAFLKIAEETSEDGTDIKKLYVAQNAAGSYSAMTKILKRYKFNFDMTSQDDIPTPITQVDFSSFPGSVTSQDEFYILRGKDLRMAVTGTTLRTYNEKLWKEVNITNELPLGPRLSAANRLATNVSSWAHVLVTNNSGTGCKQWMVVDFNRFDKMHDITIPPPSGLAKEEVVTEISNDVRHTIVHRQGLGGLLWLIEQVPGRTHARDLSFKLLEDGYFATYGLPFSDDIVKYIHVDKMEELYGETFSKLESPRAVAFAAGSKNATTLESIFKLMRQNNVTAIRSKDLVCSDEVECIIKEGGYSVLGVRGDILSKHREPYGITDTKVVSSTVHEDALSFVAIASPPFTEVPQLNTTTLLLNKGTVASVYTDQFDDKTDFNGLKIRDLVQQQLEDAAEEALAELEKDIIKPFQWSQSDFKDSPPALLPDKWNFDQYVPKWSW
ncbi:phospholipase B domain-containing protein [Phthorimaea operculella]|nr:phospholipase B domain-containing protein [Phthorimaea operculella]